MDEFEQSPPIISRSPVELKIKHLITFKETLVLNIPKTIMLLKRKVPNLTNFSKGDLQNSVVPSGDPTSASPSCCDLVLEENLPSNNKTYFQTTKYSLPFR